MWVASASTPQSEKPLANYLCNILALLFSPHQSRFDAQLDELQDCVRRACDGIINVPDSGTQDCYLEPDVTDLVTTKTATVPQNVGWQHLEIRSDHGQRA